MKFVDIMDNSMIGMLLCMMVFVAMTPFVLLSMFLDSISGTLVFPWDYCADNEE